MERTSAATRGTAKRWRSFRRKPPGARYAYTGWRVLERFGNFTYMPASPRPGAPTRSAVHMASIGHLLAGDAVYGPRNCIKA